MPEVERPKALQDAKPTERSLKGKGVGDFQGIVRFLGRAGVGREVGVTIPPVVARIFSGDSTSPLTREASVVVLFEG